MLYINIIVHNLLFILQNETYAIKNEQNENIFDDVYIVFEMKLYFCIKIVASVDIESWRIACNYCSRTNEIKYAQ